MDQLTFFVVLALVMSIYVIGLVVYRLFFHPLSSFPGSKIAAATLWYEFYWDVIQEGRLIFRIKEMHEKFGPIVRINPYELHILDHGFYNEIYAPTTGNKRRDKYEWWCSTAGAPTSAFSTPGHELHRLRRAPMNHFFSKQAVRGLESLIRSKVEKLVTRLDDCVKKQSVVRIDCAFMALTMDVICSYCFGHDRGYLEKPDFGRDWRDTVNGAKQKGALMRAFPWLLFLMKRFPRSLAGKLDQQMAMLLAWQDGVRDAVRPILLGQSDEQRTIFHTLRDSDLPPQEKTLDRLCDEGNILVGAGSETTARTLSTLVFYLCTSPECLRKVQEELGLMMQGSSADTPIWGSLERLPYFSAVIQEGLRLSYGLSTRLPRVACEPIKYHKWLIPSGTPVSSTPYFLLIDPTVFPSPEVFDPQRWLVYDGSRLNPAMERYQVSFNKGSRQCIGINLAYAELYLTAAALFSTFEFELFETGYEAVKVEHDFFTTAPADSFAGIKVLVRKIGA